MDRKIDEVIALAKQAGIKKIEVQSYNYNVYPVSSGYAPAPGVAIPYQYNGSVSFAIDPLAKGPESDGAAVGQGLLGQPQRERVSPVPIVVRRVRSTVLKRRAAADSSEAN